MASSEPLTATAAAIERAFRIPAGRIRMYASEGRIPKPPRGQRPALYDVQAVLAERDRARDTMDGWETAC